MTKRWGMWKQWPWVSRHMVKIHRSMLESCWCHPSLKVKYYDAAAAAAVDGKKINIVDRRPQHFWQEIKFHFVWGISREWPLACTYGIFLAHCWTMGFGIYVSMEGIRWNANIVSWSMELTKWNCNNSPPNLLKQQK